MLYNLPILLLCLTPYDEALETHLVTNRPLVVIISAEWCGPCKILKKKLQEIQESKKYDIIITEIEYDSKYAVDHKFDDKIPQLIIRFKDGETRKRENYLGDIPKEKLQTIFQRWKK